MLQRSREEHFNCRHCLSCLSSIVVVVAPLFFRNGRVVSKQQSGRDGTSATMIARRCLSCRSFFSSRRVFRFSRVNVVVVVVAGMLVSTISVQCQQSGQRLSSVVDRASLCRRSPPRPVNLFLHTSQKVEKKFVEREPARTHVVSHDASPKRGARISDHLTAIVAAVVLDLVS